MEEKINVLGILDRDIKTLKTHGEDSLMACNFYMREAKRILEKLGFKVEKIKNKQKKYVYGILEYDENYVEVIFYYNETKYNVIKKIDVYVNKERKNINYLRKIASDLDIFINPLIETIDFDNYIEQMRQ